jgi:hypothetical protein
MDMETPQGWLAGRSMAEGRCGVKKVPVAAGMVASTYLRILALVFSGFFSKRT